MNVKIFIERPLLPIVISVMIVSLGVIAMLTLPIEKYPDIAPPTISVWASYPEASAEAVQKSVVSPTMKLFFPTTLSIISRRLCSESKMWVRSRCLVRSMPFASG